VTQGTGSTLAGRRKVAARLRQLRAEAGRTEQEAAGYLDCPVPRFQRIEAGMAALRLAEACSMLDFYGVAGARREELLGEARRIRDRCWWHPYDDLIDEAFETQLILEDDASALRTYQPNLVPGLLQTERYAWELIETQSDLPLETVRRHARLRVMRQRVLSRDGAPRLAVILDEAVLRRPVGAPAVMREQYGHLAQMAGTQGVTIQVLPFKAGARAAVGMGFHIFEFTGGEPGVVEIELLDRVHFVAESREVASYATAFELASQYALDPGQSRTLLEELALTA
jgi:hypothetical protein